MIKALLCIGAVALLACLAFSAYVDHNVCSGLSTQNAYIVASLQRSLKTVPTLDYYKHHPHERDAALASIRAEIKVFSQPACR